MQTSPGHQQTCVEDSDGVPGDGGKESAIRGEGGHGGHKWSGGYRRSTMRRAEVESL